jgi:Acyl-CoA carboxylase epsilon subunit
VAGLSAQAGHGDAHVISVVRGEPTAAELAALVAVLVARARGGEAALAGPAAQAPASRSGWLNKSQLMREPVAVGHGAWKRSALPR